MTISQSDTQEMARILAAMNGTAMPQRSAQPNTQAAETVELAGPGVPTSKDIAAMAQVLQKLNEVTGSVAKEMVAESQHDRFMMDAVSTSRTTSGVKVGGYKIDIKTDDSRLAGKQYYQISNAKTGDVIASDLSLYETALGVVRLLNEGSYANTPAVRELFSLDDSYTSHRLDALMYKRRILTAGRLNESRNIDIYQSRYQASLDRCMQAKAHIKKLVGRP